MGSRWYEALSVSFSTHTISILTSFFFVLILYLLKGKKKKGIFTQNLTFLHSVTGCKLVLAAKDLK